jgi:ribosomal protein S18 acetylase RimI-like enzyme
MIVTPEYRKQGIGTKLLEEIILEAKNRKVLNLFLSVTSTNQVAIHMYQLVGFKRYGIEERTIKIKDTYFDTDLMAMYL